MIKNLRPPSTQIFMARTHAFIEASTAEKMVPVSNASLLKNPANNQVEPVPERGQRPLRKVGDVYGNYIVKTELKAVPVSNSTLLQAKRADPYTGTFIMRKNEPMPVPSGISKEYRKLLNLNVLPAAYALNKGPKKIELAFLEKLTNDNAKRIVLEFMNNSIAGSIYNPLRIIHRGEIGVEQNSQAKQAYDSAIQEMTELYQRGVTQGSGINLVLDKFMAELRKIYNTKSFNIDEYLDPNELELSIEKLKEAGYEAAGKFRRDREDPNNQATQEQTLAALQNMLLSIKTGTKPDESVLREVVQAPLPIAGAVAGAAADTVNDEIAQKAKAELDNAERKIQEQNLEKEQLVEQSLKLVDLIKLKEREKMELGRLRRIDDNYDAQGIISEDPKRINLQAQINLRLDNIIKYDEIIGKKWLNQRLHNH